MEEGESVDGSREQNCLYGNAIKANKETNSGACTNTMDIDINSGPGSADKSVDPIFICLSYCLKMVTIKHFQKVF